MNSVWQAHPGRKTIVEVWPSRLALEQRQAELGRRVPGGLVLGRRLFTFEGRHGLLEALCAGEIPGSGRRPLPELAGPLLLHRLLRDPGHPEPLLLGVALSRRLPHRLWRLLVQVRAAGLNAGDLADLAVREGRGQGPRLAALVRLLGRYEMALAELGLADEADLLGELTRRLCEGRPPSLLTSWSALEVRAALWLRPLDLRLLKALRRALPVMVRFALLEPRQDRREVYRLLRVTADYLESGIVGGIEISWDDAADQAGPLAELAAEGMGPGGALSSRAAACLELRRYPGRYAEVEGLVRRAWELVGRGVPHHDIALIFPNLALYGQMAADAATRIGLAISLRRGGTLSASPLAQAFLGLLELPLRGYEGPALSRVWQSPYLGLALSRVLAPRLGSEKACHLAGEVAPRAGRLLDQAGYVDAREIPAKIWLERAAGRDPRNRQAFFTLALACAYLVDLLSPLSEPQGLGSYAHRALALAQQLGVSAPPAQTAVGLPLDERWQGCPAPEAVLCRDLAMGQALLDGLETLAEAATAVETGEQANPGRLLAQLREALGERDAGQARAGQGGRGEVRVLRLEDAQGLALRYVLVGGLNQGEFPQRPAQNLLSGPERLALGRRAGLPVWRTEEEEYGGQVLRLLLPLVQAGEGAILSCAAADAQGRELAPAFVLNDLALRQGRKLPAPVGGVYGDLPPLDQAIDQLGFWGGLSVALARPGIEAGTQELAQAALFAATRVPDRARRWRDMLSRASTEEKRATLDMLLADPGPFGGRLRHPQALKLLGLVMAASERRQISSSWLETYAACPHAWFFGRLLRLKPLHQPGWDLKRIQEGNWVHYALAFFFAPAEFDPSWSSAQRATRLEQCLARAQEELAGGGQAGHDWVLAARAEVLSRSLSLVVKRELVDLEGGLKAQAVEEWLGPQGAGLPLVVDDEAPLMLKGRLDRRDGDEAGALVRVTDYKHTRNKSGLRAFLRQADLGVTAFQMPLYLAGALVQAGAPKAAVTGRVVPTALVGDEAGILTYAPGDGFLALDPALRQTMAKEGEPNLFNAIADLWRRLMRGELAPRPDKVVCTNCNFVGLCRAPKLSTPPGRQAGEEGGDA